MRPLLQNLLFDNREEKCKEKLLVGHLPIMATIVVCLPCYGILTGLLYNIVNKELDAWSLYYKSLHNLIALEILSHYIPITILIQYQSRLHYQLSYIHPHARTNTYKYSLFPRTLSECNSLPTGVIIYNTVSFSKPARLQFTSLYVIKLSL